MTESSDLKPAFSFEDYKRYLRHLIDGKERGFITRLAEAAPCQRSYLSKVVHGEVHITTDQAFNISQFLHHSLLEQDYFFSMVEFSRASSLAYRNHLKARLSSLRKENEDLAKKLERPSLDDREKESFYYSSYLPSCVHILLSLPGIETVEQVSRTLQIPQLLTQQILDELERHGLVRKEGLKYFFAGSSVHVSRHSPFVVFHHQNWRHQACLKAQLRNPGEVHYTSIQSMSRFAYEQIKNEMLKAIESASHIAGPSQEEVLVAYLTDLFVIA